MVYVGFLLWEIQIQKFELHINQNAFIKKKKKREGPNAQTDSLELNFYFQRLLGGKNCLFKRVWIDNLP